MPAKSDFSQKLLTWFETNGRDFPWRHTRNPYEILVAEKLLQQTSVRGSLIEAYRFLLHKFPTPDTLSLASVSDIRLIIQPLGLLYRANDLILMAQDIVQRFNGEVPTSLEDLLSIYGIGDYSARAVLSFAYELDYAVVDTNVARIIYRVFHIEEKFPSNPARSRKLIDLAQNHLPKGYSKEFNWALIDLGAQLCLSKKTYCKECPLHSVCKYAQILR